MQTIFELLNRIRWDQNLKQDEYSIFYLDRFSNKLIKIPFAEIKDISKNFFILKDESNIPLHRIKKVKRNNKLIWERLK